MPKARILIIDDDPLITHALQAHLSSEGYDVKGAYKAQEGFDLAIQSPPNLILLDVMLPDATGFQMLGRLRENPVTKTIPVVLMSGIARHASQRSLGKTMGADAYLVKPFLLQEASDCIHEILKDTMGLKLDLEPSLPAPVNILPHPETASAPAESPPPPAEKNFEIPAYVSSASPSSRWVFLWGIVLTVILIAGILALVHRQP